ncbi:hypothetical protein ACFVAK_19800 [Bacillus velezensis]
MEKRNGALSIGLQWAGAVQRTKSAAQGRVAENRLIQSFVAKKWSILLLLMAFLLGRAMILEELAPFSIAFFAVMYFQRRDLLLWTGVFLFAGSLLAVQPQSGFILTEMVVFLLIQKGLEKYERSDTEQIPARARARHVTSITSSHREY